MRRYVHPAPALLLLPLNQWGLVPMLVPARAKSFDPRLWMTISENLSTEACRLYVNDPQMQNILFDLARVLA
jgi:hypothetical protein